MAYTPEPFSGSNDPQELRAYLEREFQNISRQFTLVEQGRYFPLLANAPAKPRPGTFVLADGQNWNPYAGQGAYIWFPYDQDGAQWIQLLLNGGRGGFGWDDEISDISLSNSVNDPKSKQFIGNINAIAFEDHNSVQTEDAVGAFIHIRHSYAEGTKIYPHIHWSAKSTGRVRWGIEYTVAKGHQQETFAATTTVMLEQTISTPFMHMIAEVPDANAIPASHLEPDSLILFRIWRNSSHGNDTLNGQDAFMFKFDCHYQRGGQVATKNKAPNFYSGV